MLSGNASAASVTPAKISVISRARLPGSSTPAGWGSDPNFAGACWATFTGSLPAQSVMSASAHHAGGSSCADIGGPCVFDSPTTGHA
jgi:hypothetical protein